MFSTKKQKVLLIINIIIIILYFVFDIAGIALFVTSEFNILWKFISIVLPWSVIFFTAPRTSNGYKITVSIWSALLVFYYIYNGNVQIKGNEYMHGLIGAELITDKLFVNIIISVILSFLAFLSGLGILYRFKKKRKNSKNSTATKVEEKPLEYIYYDENGNISETPTKHRALK